MFTASGFSRVMSHALLRNWTPGLPAYEEAPVASRKGWRSPLIRSAPAGWCMNDPIHHKVVADAGAELG